jgi:hypothetical protein
MGTTRRFATADQRALVARFKLKHWIEKDYRRDLYFAYAAEARLMLQSVTGTADPSDAALMRMVGIALSEDDSLTSHVLNRRDVDYDLSEIQLAAAAMICEMQLQRGATA